jgi:PAS domain S-box-containing protein
MGLYEEAIKSAHENGFIQNEALAYELASRFYRERNFELFANTYLVKARDRYFRWGAYGKVNQLEEQFSFLKVNQPQLESVPLEGIPMKQLDVLSIIKSSQAISLQINFEKLAADLMRIVIQQAAAEKAFLFLDKDNQLMLVAQAKNINDALSIETGILKQELERELLAESVVHYVKRSKEKIILEDASVPNQFTTDEYILSARPKSIACLPILKQTKLIGILYLENNLFTDAFPANKILILELLAAQAAISIENSHLFSDLQNSRQQLQDVMNNSSAMISIKDLEGRYLFINRQYERLFTISYEKAVGMTDYDLWPEKFADIVTKNDERVIEEEKAITFEETIPESDGDHTYVVVKFPLRDATGRLYATCGIATDITDRKRAEEALIEKEARIRRLVDSNIIGIFFFNINGKITEGNEAFRRITGYTFHDIQSGKVKWMKLTPEEYIEVDAKAIDEIRNTGYTSPYEKEFFRKDKSRISVLVGGALLEGSKEIGIGFVLDLTDLKKAEQEIRRLNQNLQHRIEELTASQNELQKVNTDLIKTNIDLDNFIYAASHNVKGPAATLEGIINLLDLGLYKYEELPSIISMMKSVMAKFNQTIVDLTELSKVQKTIESKDVENNNIEEVVEDIKKELKGIIEDSKTTIVTDFNQISIIKFSKLNFRRILYNLLHNAITFRSPDRLSEIIIKSSQNQEFYVLTVMDNGLGIAKSNQEKIFEMFKRGQDYAVGRGIGLYIVKRIIENAGGKVEVESEQGKGSTFKIYFRK